MVRCSIALVHYLDILEGVISDSTFAGVVAEVAGAVDQVLLAQRDQLSGFPEVLSLESPGG